MRRKYESKKNIHPVFFNQINKELRDWKYKFCRQISMEGVSIAQHLNGSFRLFLRPRKATAPDFSFVFFLINNNVDYFSSFFLQSVAAIFSLKYRRSWFHIAQLGVLYIWSIDCWQANQFVKKKISWIKRLQSQALSRLLLGGRVDPAPPTP